MIAPIRWHDKASRRVKNAVGLAEMASADVHEGVNLGREIPLFRPFSARREPYWRAMIRSSLQSVRLGGNFGISQPPSPPGFHAEPDHLLKRWIAPPDDDCLTRFGAFFIGRFRWARHPCFPIHQR
jgi:hypothetical protein